MNEEAWMVMKFIGLASGAFACRWSVHGWEFWYAMPNGGFDYWWGAWDGSQTLRSAS